MDDIIKLLKASHLMSKEEKKVFAKIIQIYDRTNPIYYPLYENKDRYLVLMGGGGSGKSIFAGQKLLKRLTEEKGHRFLVVRKVAKTLRDSCFQQLKGQISEYYDPLQFDINKTDMRIVYKPNGNEVIFSGLDKQHCSV
jgi:phage terminase large subunit